MSTGNVVDSKIVELQFDNQNFESNAKTSLSTLERLKAALNFSKDTKGFDEVAKSAKNFDIRNLSSGVDSFRLSLSNIAKVGAFRVLSGEIESAWNAAKGLMGELSELNGYRGIMAGFDKYSEKTSAVQTIMAATAKDFEDTGVQMEYVNAQLDKLNWFTDETSYSFLDMVNNIGKFTSNNIPLAESVTAMEGISTWAAVSGANVNEAGRAMYNLSQAMATGAVKLMDWKSIENANMATAEFKQTAIDTAVELGQLTKVQEGLYKTTKGTEVSITSFNQTLSEGWFSSDVLMKSLAKYGEFTDKLHGVMEQVDVDTTSQMIEYIEQFKDGTIDIDEAAKDAGVSVAEMTKYLSELSDESLAFGMKAFKAAQEAKTFQEAIDATKDAVSTGWMNTWEIIFGDYQQAKKLWTGVANGLWDVFASGAEGRNDYLKEAFQTERMLDSGQWGDLEKAGIASPEFTKALREVAKEHGHATAGMISDAGWLEQALKGEYLSMDLVDEALTRLGKKTPAVNEEMKKQAEELVNSDETFKELYSTLEKYSAEDIGEVVFGDGQLQEGYEELEQTMDKLISKMGLTQDQAGEFVEVLKGMGMFGGKVGDVADEYKGLSDAQKDVLENIRIQNMKGTELFGGGIVNAIGAVAGVIYSFREAWSETFDGLDAGGLRDILEGFYRGTLRIKEFTENSEALKTVFKAIAAVANIAFKALSSGLTIIGKGVSIILGPLGKLIDYLCKAVIAASDWINKSNLLGKATQFFSVKFDEAAKGVNEWLSAFGKMPIVSRNVNRFKAAFGKTFENLPGLIDTARAGFTQFTTSIKDTSKLKKLSFSDIADSFRTNVLDPIANSDVFAPITAAFRLFKNDIKQNLVAAGVDVDGIAAKFKAFGDGVKFAFDLVVSAVKSVAGKVPEMIQQFKELPLVSNVLTKVGKGFDLVKSKSGTFFEEAGVKFKGFLDGITSLKDNFTLENVGKAFESLKATLKDIWDSENNPFKDIIEGAKNLGREISGKFVNFKGFDGLKKAFTDISDTVLGLFTGEKSIADIGEVFSNLKDSIVETFTGTDFAGAIGDAFSGIGEKIKGFLSDHGINVDGIIEAFEKIKTAITGFFDGIEVPKPLADFFDFITGTIKAEAAEVGTVAEDTEEHGNALTDAIKSISEGLKEAAEAAGPAGEVINNIIKPITAIISMLITIKGIKTLIKLGKAAISGLKDIVTGIVGVLNAQAEDLKAGAKLKKAQAAAIGIAAFIGAILGIILAIKLLNGMSSTELITGLGIVAGIMIALMVVAAIMSKLNGKATLAAGGGVFLLVLSILGVMGLIKLLEHYKVDVQALIARWQSIAILFGVLAGLLLLTRAIGPNAAGAAATILAMAGAIAAIALIAFLLGQVDPAKLQQGMQAVFQISLIMGLLMAVASYLKGGMGTILALAIAVGVIGIVVASLAALDPEILRNVSESLSMVLAALGFLMLVTGLAKPALTGVLALIVIFGVVVGVIALIAKFADVGKYVAIADALGKVFLALGVAMLLISAAAFIAQAAAPGFLILGAAFVVIGAVIAAIGAACNQWPALESAIEKGCQVLVMISGAIGEALGSFIGNAIAGMTEGLDGTGEAIVDLFEELQPLNDLEPLDSEKITQALDTVIAVSKAGFWSGIRDAVLHFIKAKGAMEQFKSDTGTLADALVDWQAKMETIASITVPDISDLVDALEEVPGTGLVDIIANFFVGAPDTEAFKENTSLLADALVDWQAKMETIAEITVPDISELVAQMEKIPGEGGLINVIASIFTGEQNFDTFKENAANLADALTDWQSKMDTIAAITVPDISELVEQMKKIPEEGGLVDVVTNFFSGEQNYDSFKENTGTLADALTDWQSKMDTIAAITVPDISDLVEQMEEIPEEGGLVDAVTNFFDGEQNFDSFKENSGTLASALTEWQTNMNDIAAITVPDFTGLIQAMEEIPKEGGLIKTIEGIFGGTQNFDGFADNLKSLGEGLKGFTDALGTDLNTEVLTTATEAVTLLGQMGTELKGQDFGGWFHEGDMTNFGGELVTLGQKLQEFASYNIDTEKLATLADSAQTLGTFGKFVSDISISEDNVTGLETAVKKLQTATEDLNAIDLSSSDIMDTGKVSKFKSNIETMVKAIKEAQNVKSGVSGFIDAVDELNQASVNASQMATSKLEDVDADMSSVGAKAAESASQGIADNAGMVSDAMTDAVGQAAEIAGAASSQFNDVGAGFMTSMMLGITMTGSIVSTAVGTVASSAASVANQYQSEFESAGSNMVQGLANGISNNASAAINAAVKVVRDTINAANAEAGIASPSKVMYKTGDFFVQGFANGIRENARHAVIVSRDMMSEALASFKGASEAIKDILTGNFDGGPVIRPVLDLSNVEAGSSRLSNMFNSNMPIGVSANVRAINGSVSSRNAVSNMDILDALNRLNANLSNVKGGDTFQVNGITYDDGSNISMAVRDLIRTVRVGRRM